MKAYSSDDFKSASHPINGRSLKHVKTSVKNCYHGIVNKVLHNFGAYYHNA